jgi:transposase-like protein
MRRRKHSREFKIEAVKLVGECGVSATQAARDLESSRECPSQMGEGVRLILFRPSPATREAT